jgi:hypothetical protein
MVIPASATRTALVAVVMEDADEVGWTWVRQSEKSGRMREGREKR